MYKVIVNKSFDVVFNDESSLVYYLELSRDNFGNEFLNSLEIYEFDERRNAFVLTELSNYID